VLAPSYQSQTPSQSPSPAAFFDQVRLLSLDICKMVMNHQSSSSSSQEWNIDHMPWGDWSGNLPPEAYMYRSLPPPPPWADVTEGDEEVLKQVKKLVLVQHAEHLKTHSKLWSKSKQLQELTTSFNDQKKKIVDLEALVQELKQDITLKDRMLLEEGKDIEEMKDTIVELEREVRQKDKIILQQKALIDSLQQSVQQ
jgi:hypothetical protein